MKRIIGLCIGLLLFCGGNVTAATVINPGDSWDGYFQSVYDPASNFLDRLDFFEPGQVNPAWQLHNNGINAIGFFMQKWLLFQPGEKLVFDLDSAGTWQMQDGANVYSGMVTDLSFSGTLPLTITLDSRNYVLGNMLPDTGSAATSAVPVPGAVWLLGSGLLGLLRLRKRE